MVTHELSGPIRTNRSSLRKPLFCEWTEFQKMDSSEDWTRITRISTQIGEKTRLVRIWPSASKIRPAPSGGMDWWRMEWPFSRVRKIFSEAEISRKMPENSAERTIFAKFQAPKFENSEPEKMQFHTPSHSIPPLDSLLKIGFCCCESIRANLRNVGVRIACPLSKPMNKDGKKITDGKAGGVHHNYGKPPK